MDSVATPPTTLPPTTGDSIPYKDSTRVDLSKRTDTTSPITPTTPATPPQNTPQAIQYPWIPSSIYRQTINRLGWSTVFSCITALILAWLCYNQLHREPWILRETENGFESVQAQHHQATRKDIERYLNFVIPNLFGIVGGETTGLEQLSGLVNDNVLNAQKNDVAQKAQFLKGQNVSQFSLVTGINPETMRIDPVKKIAYCEVSLSTVVTRRNEAVTSNSQYRCLIYLVPPVSKLTTETRKGTIAGNRFGLFLWQLDEQQVGTENQDIPAPINRQEAPKAKQNPGLK